MMEGSWNKDGWNICLFCLEDKLETIDTIEIYHFLESVKIMNGGKDNEQELYGYITANAISLAEIENPDTNRSICMAITATDSDIEKMDDHLHGQSAIDAIISGAYESEEPGNKRIMFVSAGNTSVPEIIEAGDYETAVINHSVEDPGQAWNAITVGAYTDKFEISDPAYAEDFEVVVEPGSYSPFTSSSLDWDKKWPVKPDIVLEGGNLAYDKSSNFYSEFEDLQLLTTNKDFMLGKSFDTINMTSSATAQAAWLGANIQHHYPELWPETVRALIIHSAEWTDAMKRKILGTGKPKRMIIEIFFEFADMESLVLIGQYGVLKIV